MKIAALALLSAASLIPLAAHAQTQVTLAETAPVVTLNITESVEAAPDVATVGTGVETRAPTAREAMAANAVQMDRLIAALAKGGIAKKDIQTSGIRLNAQYDYSARNPDGSQAAAKFVGYEAANQLSITVRDVKRVGDLLDRMAAAGATSISGPTFGIDDPAPLLVQARGQALKSAKAQAEYYAQQTGYRTVRLISISEASNGGGAPMPMVQMRMSADMAKSTPVEPGQVSASVSLTLQYALER